MTVIFVFVLTCLSPLRDNNLCTCFDLAPSPQSSTLAQHCTNVIQMFCVCWALTFTCDAVRIEEESVCTGAGKSWSQIITGRGVTHTRRALCTLIHVCNGENKQTRAVATLKRMQLNNIDTFPMRPRTKARMRRN